MTLAQQILRFQKELHLDSKLPKGVEVMNPYQHASVRTLCETFYKKFYDDNHQRTMIIGINPGRFGGGITGIPFTDPIKLEELGIHNSLPKKRELSADFVYEVIKTCGGAERFYHKFYVSAVSPLGFVNNEKNLNYYDLKELPKLLNTFIVSCMRKQLSWGLNTSICFCLGEGENYKFVSQLNETHHFFKEIVPLAHPRFIMQYRRKTLSEFVTKYKDKLGL